MKLLFLFLVHAFSFCICFSQHTRFNKKDSSLVLNAESVYYDLEREKSKHPGKLPFNKITFLDVRYDTSFIAINWQVNRGPIIGGNKKYNKKFNLKGGLAPHLNDYFNEYYKDNFARDNESIVCYIKKLSVNLKDTLSEDRHADASINNIKVEIECFYKKGDLLFPAVRFDTAYAETISRIKKTFTELVKDIINPFIDHLNSIDTSMVLSRKSYTEEQITGRYTNRFSIPILTDQYKKGVYANFKEFRNNSPSITVFKVRSKGAITLLYDSKDDIINSLKIFGFCDGATCWIQYGAYCFPLVRVGNSFEFLYPLQVKTGNTVYVIKILLALDMESGNFY